MGRLVERGHGYVVDGDVFFDVMSFPGYGKLAKQSLEDLLSGARIEVDPRKRHPLDFALWKGKKEGEPSWESPWGEGRPGWHIECSAMAMALLGETIDIHAGGSDLVFPHHENEIAQAEAATGKPFVRYWIHNGYILMDQEKMSKSLGNILTAREARERFSPSAIRLFMLSAHYRSPISFSDESLGQAESAVARIRNSYELVSAPVGGTGPPKGRHFRSTRRWSFHAARRCFNTAGAIEPFSSREDHQPGHVGAKASRPLSGKPFPSSTMPTGLVEMTEGGDKSLEKRWRPPGGKERARARGLRGPIPKRQLASRGIILEDTPIGPVDGPERTSHDRPVREGRA